MGGGVCTVCVGVTRVREFQSIFPRTSCGNTSWFSCPKLLFTNSKGTTGLLDFELPCRAQHKTKGSGYSRLLSDAGTNKYQSLFLKDGAAANGACGGFLLRACGGDQAIGTLLAVGGELVEAPTLVSTPFAPCGQP